MAGRPAAPASRTAITLACTATTCDSTDAARAVSPARAGAVEPPRLDNRTAQL